MTTGGVRGQLGHVGRMESRNNFEGELSSVEVWVGLARGDAEVVTTSHSRLD